MWNPDNEYARAADRCTLPAEVEPPWPLLATTAHLAAELVLTAERQAGRLPDARRPKRLVWVGPMQNANHGRAVGGRHAKTATADYLLLSSELADLDPPATIEAVLHELGHACGHESEEGATAFANKYLVAVLRALNNWLESDYYGPWATMILGPALQPTAFPNYRS